MTTKQFKERMRISKAGYGHFDVTIEYRGREYKCVTTNTLAIDAIGEDPDRHRFYTTEKQALLALWNECKRKNDLR